MSQIEIRDNCKICGKPLPNSRFRTYCSKTCRNKAFNVKYAERQSQWQKDRRDKIASVSSTEKVQCLICKRWYVQLGSHTVQIHKITGREYREQFNLEVKRGIVPDWYRKEKGDQALENGTFNNLKNGAKFRWKKGDTVPVYKRAPATLEKLRVARHLKGKEKAE